MYFLAASMGDVSDCNQFLLEHTHGTWPHWEFQHIETHESIRQHAGNSRKLPLQRYNNRILLSVGRWTNAPCSYHDNVTFWGVI